MIHIAESVFDTEPRHVIAMQEQCDLEWRQLLRLPVFGGLRVVGTVEREVREAALRRWIFSEYRSQGSLMLEGQVV